MILYILADLIVAAVVGVIYERRRQNKAERSSRGGDVARSVPASSPARSAVSPPGGPPATPSSSPG